MIKEREVWMDILRGISIFMVILIHTPLPATESQISLSVYNYLSAPAVGLFFMLSGALLLPTKPESTKLFYLKRLSKVTIPLIVWSIFYVLIDSNKSLSLLLMIPFKPVHGVLWFVYVLISLYLIAPIISPWLHSVSKKNLQLILLLWSITLLFPYLQTIIPDLYISKPSNAGGLLLVNPIFYFSGYVGYFLLGYYLNKYPLKLQGRQFLLLIVTFFMICVILPGIVYLYPSNVIENSIVYNYLTINIALLSTIYFSIIQRISFQNFRINQIVVEFSKMSFGIYLIHIFILRDVVWNWFGMVNIMNPAFQIPLMAIITFVCSYIIVKMISYLPKSKYIIGI